MRTGYKVCDAMTKKPISVPSSTTLLECGKIMAKMHVGALLVTNGKNLLGIASEQDIVRKAVSQDYLPSKKTVESVMVSDVHTIAPEKDIFEAIMMMRDLNIRHLPVSDGKEMIGLLTMKDVLKIEPQLFDILVEKMEIRESETKPINRSPASEGICELCGEYSEEIKMHGRSALCPDCKKNSGNS